MSYVIQSTDDPPFARCNDCDGGKNGYLGHGEYCGNCNGTGEYPFDMSRLDTLGHNLAIAGGLQRANQIGYARCAGNHEGALLWRPGCGTSAP